jgi:uncharacterized membrane protein YeaQ/YmgE (transglycosylase-associated protein family)
MRKLSENGFVVASSIIQAVILLIIITTISGIIEDAKHGPMLAIAIGIVGLLIAKNVLEVFFIHTVFYDPQYLYVRPVVGIRFGKVPLNQVDRVEAKPKSGSIFFTKLYPSRYVIYTEGDDGRNEKFTFYMKGGNRSDQAMNNFLECVNRITDKPGDRISRE